MDGVKNDDKGGGIVETLWSILEPLISFGEIRLQILCAIGVSRRPTGRWSYNQRVLVVEHAERFIADLSAGPGESWLNPLISDLGERRLHNSDWLLLGDRELPNVIAELG